MTDADFDESLIPEHLRYIDEIEAKAKPEFHFEESKENTLETSELEASSPINIKNAFSPRMENITNYPSVLNKTRFTIKVPEHFTCKLCGNIVKDPVECESCENLLCKSCKDSSNECPWGCEVFKFKPLAKFAANVYLALTLECKNKPFGCPFVGSIKTMQSHEDNCLYVISQCENSLCDRYILKKDRVKEAGVPLLCSEVCESMIRFSLMIDEKNVLETLQHFSGLSERCKKLIEYDVKAEMQDKYKKIEENKRESALFKKRKEKMEKDMQTWLNCYHPGKWNLRTSKWTCCGTHELLTVGCKYIS